MIFDPLQHSFPFLTARLPKIFYLLLCKFFFTKLPQGCNDLLGSQMVVCCMLLVVKIRSSPSVFVWKLFTPLWFLETKTSFWSIELTILLITCLQKGFCSSFVHLLHELYSICVIGMLNSLDCFFTWKYFSSTSCPCVSGNRISTIFLWWNLFCPYQLIIEL